MLQSSKLWLCVPLLLSACATQQLALPRALDVPRKAELTTVLPEADKGQEGKTGTQVVETPKPPQGRTDTVRTTPVPSKQPDGAADINLALEQVPLTTFIQVVYTEILKKNVNIDPAVMARQDLITIRTGTPQTPKQVEDSAILLLKSYGVAVVDLGNIIRIVPDNADIGYLPEIRRGRALPETPLPLRPIFQLVELQAVRNPDVAAWLIAMYGTKVKVVDDPNRNAVWLSGQSADVAAALEAIHVLDQPLMRGRHSRRVVPAFMSADEMSKKLADVLQAEGYVAGISTAGGTAPVLLVPVPTANSVIVFALDEAILDHVVAWAADLDKRNEQQTSGRGVFSYQVKSTDAQALANTLERVLGGQVAPATTASGDKAAPAAAASRRVVVDAGSNTLIFQGGGEDYSQLRSLLETLDKPSKQALIEVTVAEVTLDKNSQLGVEWLIKGLGPGSGGTLGGTDIGSSGFNYKIFDSAGKLRFLLNALASDSRATVLSTPRLMARNGEEASIQVGQEVPIITSQQSNVTTGNGGVLQTVQYRTAGVLLNVKPVIHSGNQIDLEISQEVSSAGVTKTGVSTTPTFSTRRLQTKLSLKDGSTILMGGLISNNASDGNAGIPLLKDIPGLGQLFRTNTVKDNRVELIVLITPYIISDDHEALAITEAFKNQLGKWAQNPQVQDKHE